MIIQRRYLLGIVVAVLSFLVYLSTLCPTIYWGDSAELVTACATLGIPHPTGYPLYTLIGKLFTLLPFGNVAYRVNLLSSVSAALSILLLYLIILEVTGGLVPSITSALTFAFSLTFWSDALVAEVYTLNTLFMGLSILIFLKWQKRRANNLFYLFSFVYGLGFTNHMSMVLLLPAFVYIFIKAGGIKLWPRFLLLAMFWFLLGLLPYLYLPIRSMQDPFLDWGNPENLSAFIYHISGGQYRGWMFSLSPREILGQFFTYLDLLIKQFGPFPLIFVVLGLFSLYNKKRGEILIFTGLIFFVNILYSINFDIEEIENYYLPSYLVLTLWIGFGVKVVIDRMRSIGKVWLNPAVYFFLLIPLIPYQANYHQVDKTRHYFAYDYGVNVLRSVKPGSIILARESHEFFPLLYLQYVEGMGRGITVISIHSMPMPWYQEQLKREYHEVILPSQTRIEEIYQDVRREGNPPYYKTANERIALWIVDKNIDNHPVYSCLYIPIGGYVLYPDGVVYRLYKVNEIPKVVGREEKTQWSGFNLRGIWDDRIFKDRITQKMIDRYAKVHHVKGVIYQENNLIDEAILEYQTALLFNPNHKESHINLAWIYYFQKGMVLDALVELEKAKGALEEAPIRVIKEMIYADLRRRGFVQF